MAEDAAIELRKRHRDKRAGRRGGGWGWEWGRGMRSVGKAWGGGGLRGRGEDPTNTK